MNIHPSHRALRPRHRSLQARALGDRARRHPRPALRLHHAFLPGGLSLVNELAFLSAPTSVCSARCRAAPTPTSSPWSSDSSAPRCWTSAGNTALGDQVALEALVRMSDEEIKHQEMFRRLEADARRRHAARLRADADANAVAGVVLGKSTWAVLA